MSLPVRRRPPLRMPGPSPPRNSVDSPYPPRRAGARKLLLPGTGLYEIKCRNGRVYRPRLPVEPGRNRATLGCMRTHRIAAIPADGIGPEVINAGLEVLDAVAARDGNFTL